MLESLVMKLNSEMNKKIDSNYSLITEETNNKIEKCNHNIEILRNELISQGVLNKNPTSNDQFLINNTNKTYTNLEPVTSFSNQFSQQF